MKIICNNGWIGLAFTLIFNLASFSATADDLGEILVTGTRTYGEGSSWSTVNSRGASSGGPSIADARGAALATKQKEKDKKDCKDNAANQWEDCNSSAYNSHRLRSGYCGGAKWIGGSLGVAGGWAYFEGEGAGAVLLAGSGMAMYQWGDDCQRDMDRVYTAAQAQCGVDQTKEENRCDAL